jgi:hypothetical protein
MDSPAIDHLPLSAREQALAVKEQALVAREQALVKREQELAYYFECEEALVRREEELQEFSQREEAQMAAREMIVRAANRDQVRHDATGTFYPWEHVAWYPMQPVNQTVFNDVWCDHCDHRVSYENYLFCSFCHSGGCDSIVKEKHGVRWCHGCIQHVHDPLLSYSSNQWLSEPPAPPEQGKPAPLERGGTVRHDKAVHCVPIMVDQGVECLILDQC